jgi:hypothetical protein
MGIFDTLGTILVKVKNVGYWTLPIPSKVDEEITECIQSYSQLAIDDKLKIREEITISTARLLLYFSERMATLSLRTRKQHIFDTGLVGLSIASGKVDLREITTMLSLYYNASSRNNLSFDNVLGQKDEFSENVMSFLNRRDKSKRIEAMGYVVEVNEKKELTYKRTW